MHWLQLQSLQYTPGAAAAQAPQHRLHGSSGMRQTDVSDWQQIFLHVAMEHEKLHSLAVEAMLAVRLAMLAATGRRNSAPRTC